MTKFARCQSEHVSEMHTFSEWLTIDAPMLTSLGSHITIFNSKMTLKMTAELIIQFSDHARYKDLSYQRM